MLVISLFAGSVYYFSSNYSYEDFYKRLKTRAEIMAGYTFPKSDEYAKNLKSMREEHLEKLQNEKDYIITGESDQICKTKALKQKLPESFITSILNDGKYQFQKGNTFYSGLKFKNESQQYLFIVSAENYYATHHLTILRTIILISFILIAILIVFFSLFISRHVFDPIRKVTEDVKKISTDNIHLRLKEPERGDEIGLLVATFNNLLSRLETAFETQKNFISSASHEFGTPLTAIIGEAEVALMNERPSIEYREALTNILHEAERLNQISQSLLFLAQTGYRDKKQKFEILRCDEILLESKAIVDKFYPKNQIRFDFSLLPENPFKLKVSGNRHLLTLSLVNIMMNACKYSNLAPVQVSIASTDRHVVIIIADNGIGIPDSEIMHIYDPFFRASNTTRYEGYGIGLPLTRNIISIHNGTIQVNSLFNTGTTVTIRLPLAIIK